MPADNVPDLVARWQEIERPYLAPPPAPRGRIGIPRASTLFDQLPFWAPFFARLGYEVVISQPSSQRPSGGAAAAPGRDLPADQARLRPRAGTRRGRCRPHLPAVDPHPVGRRRAVLPFLPLRAGRALHDQGGSFLFAADARGPSVAGEDTFVAGLTPALSELGVGRHEIAAAYCEASAAWAEFRRQIVDAGREALAGAAARLSSSASPTMSSIRTST